MNPIAPADPSPALAPVPRDAVPASVAPSSPSAPSARRSLWLTLFCALTYLWTFNAQPTVNNPNENVRFYMTMAIVDDGTYAIDHQRERWGWTNDAATRDGHFYSVKAPGTSFLGVPGYAVYKAFASLTGATVDRDAALWGARLTGSILPVLFFLFFFHRWLSRRVRSLWTADIAVFAVALGCNFAAYATMFASHTVSAASAFGAFMLLVDARTSGRMRPGHAFLAGLLTAGVTLFEYPGALTTVLLGGFALASVRPWRQLVPFALGGLVVAAGMMHFQAACFGSPFTPGHLFVENAAFRAGHEQGFFGANEFHAEGAWKLLVGGYHGLFALAPFFLLAIPGFVFLLRRPRSPDDAPRDLWAPLIAIAICVGSWLFISFFNLWDGGWAVGPRYLTHLFPFLAWAAAVAIDRMLLRSSWLGPGLVVGLFAASLVASGVSSIWYPHPPPEFGRPLGQLYAMLLEHGYAPRNVGQLLGLHGTWSMLPLLLGWAALVGWLLVRGAGTRAAWLARLGVAGAVAALALLPLTVGTGTPTPEQRKMREFVTTSWTPATDADAARLRASLDRDGGTPEEWSALAALYQDEGRDEDARRATRKATRPPQRAHRGRPAAPESGPDTSN